MNKLFAILFFITMTIGGGTQAHYAIYETSAFQRIHFQLHCHALLAEYASHIGAAPDTKDAEFLHYCKFPKKLVDEGMTMLDVMDDPRAGHQSL